MPDNDNPESAQDASLAPQQTETIQPPVRPSLRSIWHSFSPHTKKIIWTALLWAAGIGCFWFGVDMIDIGEYSFAIVSLLVAFVAITAHIVYVSRLSRMVKAICCMVAFVVVAIYILIAYNKATAANSWTSVWPKKEHPPGIIHPTPLPVPLPSFVFIIPTGLAKTASGYTRYMALQHRGEQPVFNIHGLFVDMQRWHIGESDPRKRKSLKQAIHKIDVTEYSKEMNKEINVSTIDFPWPLLNVDNGQFDIDLTYRGGHIKQTLLIKRAGQEMKVATRVIEVGSQKVLLECKDIDFPADQSWAPGLPNCTPDFPSKQ